MRQTSRLSLLAGAAIAAIPTSAALAENQAWSTSDEVRALVSEMIADAETRSSLLQSGAVAGHDGRFFLASSDGAYRLNIGGQIQFRYIFNFRDEDGDDDDELEDDFFDGNEDFESGFQARRTKIWFAGNVADPNLFYKVQGAFNRNGGGFELEDAYVGYDFDGGWSLRWGQFKLPFLREELVSSSHQLAVDRSLVNDTFNQGRSQGIELSYMGDMWRGAFAFSDGFNSANTDFATDRMVGANFLPSSGGGEADWAFTARVEFLFSGDWDRFNDFTSPSGSDFAWMLGVAGHIEGGDDYSVGGLAASEEDWNYFSWTVDLSFEGDGWNAFFAAIGNYGDYDNVIDPADPLADGEDVENDDYGLVAQFGIMIPNTDWEFFIRWDALIADDDRFGDEDDDWFNVLTAGVNYYMHGHASKFSADVVYFIDDTNVLTGEGNTGLGYLADDEDGQVAIRLQWQLLF